MPTITDTKWHGPHPQLMPIAELKQWFDEQDFSPNDEIGKVNYTYADPVADAHNARDRQKKWQWTFSSIYADVWDEEHNASVEIPLDDSYQLLYEHLPHGENFHLPLLAAVFRKALIEVMDLKVMDQFPMEEK